MGVGSEESFCKVQSVRISVTRVKMILEINASKLRNELVSMRKKLGHHEVFDKSSQIHSRLFRLREFEQAKIVAFYVSQKDSGEVDTHEMIIDALSLKKKVLVPIVDNRSLKIVFSELDDPYADFEVGEYGIMEPKMDKRKIVSLEKADVIIVPGVVFDKRGNRLGRGSGYYDRSLSKLNTGVLKIALVYEFQVREAVPVKPHDITMDRIVTENRLIVCNA